MVFSNTNLHQIKTHCDERHPEHKIHRAKNETQLQNFAPIVAVSAAVDFVARNEIPETYRAQRDEAEIRGVQKLPTLPFTK